jgi:hypothetical protein
MQLTRFDRFLREKFVYQTHIQTLRPVELLPKGVHAVDLPDAPGKRYKYLYIAKSTKSADALISHLKENGQMYTTQVVDRDSWFVPFVAPKEKSVTWWLISTAVITTCVFFALLYLKDFVQDPEFKKNFMEALEVLKG